MPKEYVNASLHFGNASPKDKRLIKQIREEFGDKRFRLKKDKYGDEVLVPNKGVKKWRELIKKFDNSASYKLATDSFYQGVVKGIGLDIDPITATGLVLSGTSLGLNISDRIKRKINERKTIKAQQQAINHLKKELKNSDLRSTLQSIPSKLLTPADKKLLAPTKLEKELEDYWMLEGVDNKGYLPYLKKIPKMAAKHKYPEVREAAKAFQNKYGKAQLLPTYFSGQMTMLPKDKGGYIRAHRNIFEQEFMAIQREAERKNAKLNRRK